MMIALGGLPEAAWRRRLVGIDVAAAYVGRSIIEIRRLVRLGEFPKPCKPNGRRLAWQLGQRVDYSDQKMKESSAA
jgi:predicted DNA-binding transcriptional regulator AlpA